MQTNKLFSSKQKKMLTKFSLLLIVLITSIFFICTANGNALAWEKEYTGDEFKGGYGNAVIENNEGGFFIAADSITRRTTSDIRTDSTLIKIDSNGNLKWANAGMAVSPYSCHGYSVCQLSNGDGFLVGSGYTGPEDGIDIWLSRFNNSTGHCHPTDHYGGTYFQEGSYVIAVDNEKAVLTGSMSGSLTPDRIFLMKYDPTYGGTPGPIWTKTYEVGTLDSWGNCVKQTSDGGFIIVGGIGTSEDINNSDVYLVKTNQNGEEQWHKVIGHSGMESGRYIAPTNEGGYIIVGSTDSYGAGNRDIYVIKVDNAGNLLWDKYFGGTEDDIGYCIQQTDDGGYILSGVTESYSADDKILVIKMDEFGKEVWRNLLGGGNDSNAETRSSVIQTSDGSYIVIGSRNNNIYAASIEAPVAPAVPQTKYRSPEAGAVDSDENCWIYAVFDSEIEALDLSLIKIKDSQGTEVTGVSASIGEDGKNLEIEHGTLSNSEKYTVEIGAGAVKGKSSGLSNETVSWEFTTKAGNAPQLEYNLPEAGAVDSDENCWIYAVFDSEIEALDLSLIKIKDSQGTEVTGVSASIGEDGKNLEIEHGTLSNSEKYTVEIGAGAVKGKSSGLSNETVSWEFTTKAGRDPQLDSSSPESGAVDRDENCWIYAVFDSEIEALDLSQVKIKDSQGAEVTGVSASIGEDWNLEIEHGTLSNSEKYTVEIGAGAVKGKSSGLSNEAVSWEFTTIAGSAPQLDSSSPESGAVDRDENCWIYAVFDSEIEALNLSQVKIKDSQGAEVTGVSASIGEDWNLEIEHGTLSNSEKYTVEIGAGAVKGKSSGLSNEAVSWEFTTKAGSAPQLDSNSPESGEEDRDENCWIYAVFDNEIEALDLSQVKIKDSQGAEVTGVSASIGEDWNLEIEHGTLRNSEKYTVEIGAGAVKGKSSGLSNEAVSWEFTTKAGSAPQLEYNLPEAGAADSDENCWIYAVFDSEIEALDISLVKIKDSQGTELTEVSASIGEDGKSLNIEHGILNNSEKYTVEIGAGAVKGKSSGLSNETVGWEFITGTIGTDIDAVNSSTAISYDLTPGVSSNLKITLKDEYGNLIKNTNIILRIKVDVVNTVTTTNEQYLVDERIYSESTIVQLDAESDDQGQISFNILLPETIDTGDGISIQVRTTDGTSIGSIYTYPIIDECFIATAAFGSKLQPAVALLRQFRDKYLLTNTLGQEFVKFYYRNSPHIAMVIAQSEPLKVLVRILLLPFIVIAYASLHTGLLGLIMFLLVLCYRIRTKLSTDQNR